MAKKATGDSVGKVRKKPSAADKAAEELSILKPDVTLQLAGEAVEVKEYDFWTSMDIVYGERGFLDDAITLLQDSERDAWESIRSLFGRHAAYLKRAVAAAIGREVSWIESLGPRDTDALLSVWWSVNGHFFLHEATVVIRGRMTKAQLAGRRSSSSSQAPGSATSIASGGTPSGN